MFKIILTFFICFATLSKADVLTLDEVSIDAYRIESHRDPYFIEDTDKFTHGGNFNLNLRAFNYLFCENIIHIAGTDSQIREGGWKFRAGINLGKYLDVFYKHHSRHVFERARNSKQFPLDNFYGVRLYFYRREIK